MKAPDKLPMMGYEGIYEVYSDGRVYSLLTSKFIKPNTGRYNLYKEGKCRKRSITTLIREHFYVKDKELTSGILCCCEPIEDVDYGWRIIKEYPSLREAAEELGMNHTSISRGVENGWLIGGYKWIYKN